MPKKELALSDQALVTRNAAEFHSAYARMKKNPDILRRPMSEIAHRMGMTPAKLLENFLPLISRERDIGEKGKWANLGIDILTYIDKNMWRPHFPEEYAFVMDEIIGAINELIEQPEGFYKRDALKMHLKISDTMADKKRFIDAVMAEDKLVEISRAKQSVDKIDKELSEAGVIDA